jgi:hypothetical protein
MIGYKYVCIYLKNKIFPFNFNAMLEDIANLPEFAYIDVHLNDLDFKTLESQKQLLSYSIKKSNITGSVRYLDYDRETIEQFLLLN